MQSWPKVRSCRSPAAARGGSEGIELSITVGSDAEDDWIAYEDLIAEEVESHPPVEIPNDTPALIMYTSGTTGRPKGAVLTHSNMEAQSLTCIRAFRLFDESGIGFCASPIFHIAALGSVAPSLMLGTATVIHPVGAFDPDELLDVLEAENVEQPVPRAAAVAGHMCRAESETAKAEAAQYLLGCIPEFRGRSDSKWGEVPVAVIALKPGNDDLTIGERQPYLNEHLARYKHPKEIVIVDALPRNASGKVVKGDLRRRLPAVTQG